MDPDGRKVRPYTVAALNNEIGGWQQPVPAQPFSPSGEKLGCGNPTARYSDTNLNYNETQIATPTQMAGIIFGGREKIVDIGVNWHMNRNVKPQIHNSSPRRQGYSSASHPRQPGSQHPGRSPVPN